ncbi:MAG: DUF4168 domain-containing protein [Gemmatimonadota bacterium]
MRFTRSTLMAALLTALFVAPATVEAQEQVPPAQEATIEVTDELLERFVVVYPEIMEVAQSMQAQLAEAESAEAAQEIQAQAQARMEQALEESEVTPAEYEAVVQKLNQDPALMAKFEEMLEEEMGGGPGAGGL